MIERLVLLGATGDLTARYLLPGLVALRSGGHIGDGFRLVGVGREDWRDEEFRNWASAQLDQHAGSFSTAARQAVVSASEYHRADVTDPAAMTTVISGADPIAAYLALPPFVFAAAVSALHGAGLAAGSTIVLEKPFGEDLAEATELNAVLSQVIPEDAVFRVDHFLAMTTVQNVLSTRLANRALEPVWNSAHIAEIDIVWDETLALEGRAGYYDGVGALKDMLQNHLLQLLCLVAMEPPISLDARDLRDRKVDVLRSIRPLSDEDVVRHTRRARYTRGVIDGVSVPAYVDEDGVDAAHRTETFAEIELHLDNWRWYETIFRLRTGKALGRNRKEVAVHFRPVPHLPYGMRGDPQPNVLRFGLDPESVVVEIYGVGPRANTLVPLTLTAQLEPAELPAYGRLLLDVLNRNPACRSAATKQRSPGASSRLCSRHGPRTSFRSWNTPPAPTDRPTSPRVNSAHTYRKRATRDALGPGCLERTDQAAEQDHGYQRQDGTHDRHHADVQVALQMRAAADRQSVMTAPLCGRMSSVPAPITAMRCMASMLARSEGMRRPLTASKVRMPAASAVAKSRHCPP
jgi:glucose-6-phosphate 1-dehydrogenase